MKVRFMSHSPWIESVPVLEQAEKADLWSDKTCLRIHSLRSREYDNRASKFAGHVRNHAFGFSSRLIDQWNLIVL